MTYVSAKTFSIPLPLDFMFYLAHLEIAFKSLIQMVSCAKILCWSFLECISYLSFELMSTSQFSSVFLVLLHVGQVPLGLISIIQLFGWLLSDI